MTFWNISATVFHFPVDQMSSQWPWTARYRITDLWLDQINYAITVKVQFISVKWDHCWRRKNLMRRLTVTKTAVHKIESNEHTVVSVHCLMIVGAILLLTLMICVSLNITKLLFGSLKHQSVIFHSLNIFVTSCWSIWSIENMILVWNADLATDAIPDHRNVVRTSKEFWPEIVWITYIGCVQIPYHSILDKVNGKWLAISIFWYTLSVFPNLSGRQISWRSFPIYTN